MNPLTLHLLAAIGIIASLTWLLAIVRGSLLIHDLALLDVEIGGITYSLGNHKDAASMTIEYSLGGTKLTAMVPIYGVGFVRYTAAFRNFRFDRRCRRLDLIPTVALPMTPAPTSNWRYVTRENLERARGVFAPRIRG